MDVHYLDFELEIGAGDRVVYPLSVIHSPAGALRGHLQFALSRLELDNRLLALQNALLRSGGQRRKALTREEATVQAFGAEMFDALFHGDLRAMYYESKRAALAQGKGLRVKLRIVALAINNTLEWGIPVLFMQAPDGVLFEVAEGESAVKAKGEVGAEAEATGEAPAQQQPRPDAQPNRPKGSDRLTDDRLAGDRLSGDKVKELLAAMLDAYSSESSLRQMVRFELDENLDVVAGGGDLREKIFNLIDWAERTGRLPELVEKAHQFNPGNARLRTFAEAAPGVTTVAEARAGASPVDFEWVTIPAGDFLMGSDKQQDSMAYGDETPQHKVHLPEYRIARVPVTNHQYQYFVTATGHAAPEHWKSGTIPDGKEQHPVVEVSWHDAQAFCEWAKVRLPTEAEWEKAARGADGRIWPWGNEQPTDKHCNFNGNVGDTTPVSAYSPKGDSPYELADVAGNVWEWTADWFDSGYYAKSPARNPQGPESGSARTLRGGSWSNSENGVRCAYRLGGEPEVRDDDVGFRVVSPGAVDL